MSERVEMRVLRGSDGRALFPDGAIIELDGKRYRVVATVVSVVQVRNRDVEVLDTTPDYHTVIVETM